VDKFGFEMRGEEGAKMMIAWTRSDVAYKQIMNVALVIVILSALAAHEWPNVSIIAGTITIITTVAAVLLYIWDGKSKEGDEKRNQPLASRETALDVRESSVHVEAGRPASPVAPEPEGESASVERARAVLAARLALVNEELSARAMRYWDDALTVERKNVAAWHTQNFRDLRSVYGKAGPVTWMREIETMETAKANATGKVVVVVGSLTIEINEEETKIHVASPKTTVLTTSVSDNTKTDDHRERDVRVISDSVH